VGAHEIERALTQLVGHPAANDASGYGGSLAFTVKAWGDGRLGVVATLGIQCGTDSALFVFSRAGGHWSEALKWEASPYADVGGAWEAFDYALSPPDARGQWFVAAKSIHPWCSSTWSQIRWAVIRPVPGQTHPRVLRSGDQSIWWGSDDLGAIVVTRESADFRWHAESIDGGVHNRVWIRRLAVGETSASRIQPVALSAEDFVDEWIITDWAQAAAWTASPALRRAHDRLKAGHDYEFTATRACQAPTIPVGQREVEVTQGERRRWYFRISGAEDFHMLAVAPRPTPFCRGPNLYKGPGAITQ
jgi:hypothetical protein